MITNKELPDLGNHLIKATMRNGTTRYYYFLDLIPIDTFAGKIMKAQILLFDSVKHTYFTEDIDFTGWNRYDVSIDITEDIIPVKLIRKRKGGDEDEGNID